MAEGDLQMDGDIHFFATRVFYQKPCVEIKGDASAFGNIHFEKRRNEARKASDCFALLETSGFGAKDMVQRCAAKSYSLCQKRAEVESA